MLRYTENVISPATRLRLVGGPRRTQLTGRLRGAKPEWNGSEIRCVAQGTLGKGVKSPVSSPYLRFFE
eukprot:6820016-Prymnesium_polylepis.1